MKNINLRNAVILVLFIILVVGLVIGISKIKNTSTTNNNQVINNGSSEEINDDQLSNNDNSENLNDEQCEPFICYDDVSYIENKELIAKANKIDERLRKVLVLLSLSNDKQGKYTLNDVDKLTLHSLIINNFIDEDKNLILENGINNAIVLASEYEKVFTDITGIKDVKGFFKGYDLNTIKDANKSIYYEKNGQTYYIVPFGIGMETGTSVISNISEQNGIKQVVIKTFEADYENNTYTHIKTTTFEIEANGLRIYSFNVEDVK